MSLRSWENGQVSVLVFERMHLHWVSLIPRARPAPLSFPMCTCFSTGIFCRTAFGYGHGRRGFTVGVVLSRDLGIWIWVWIWALDWITDWMDFYVGLVIGLDGLHRGTYPDILSARYDKLIYLRNPLHALVSSLLAYNVYSENCALDFVCLSRCNVYFSNLIKFAPFI
jgi:hypothetical protein